MNGTQASGSRAATVTAGALIGATVGAVIGRVVAEISILNSYVSSPTRVIVGRMLVGGVIGALIGLLSGRLVARSVRISFKSLLMGIAVAVSLGGLFVAWAIVQPKCTRLIPAPGTHGVGFTCAARDLRVGLRLSIALGSLVVALLVWWASRRTAGIEEWGESEAILGRFLRSAPAGRRARRS